MDHRLASATLVSLVVAACTTVAPSGGADGADSTDRAEASTGTSRDGPSLDPRAYGTSCATTADCVLAPFVDDCFTCCTQRAVNRTAIEADLAAVDQACAAGRGSCTMACEPAHPECAGGQCIACTERPCKDGVMVHAPVATLGTHRLEAEIDGETVGCTIELPTSVHGPATITCAPGVEILPSSGSDVFTEGVLFRTKTTGAITFRATHDGTPVGEKTFTPVYVAGPGPNGPQCEPRECLLAEATLP